MSSKTQYAGSVVGAERTFCVVPVSATDAGSPTGTKRDAPDSKRGRSKKRKTESALNDEMAEGEQVQDFVDDTSKAKGAWVKCVNDLAGDEFRGHTSMFAPTRNSGYYAMLPDVRDRVTSWVATAWYESSTGEAVPEVKDLDSDLDSDPNEGPDEAAAADVRQA